MLAGALLVAAALCLEPFARRLSVNPVHYARVTVGEIAAGVIIAAAVLVRRYRQHA
jgi:hypothetical protein